MSGYLFIGGPRDGEWIAFESKHPPPTYMCHIMEPPTKDWLVGSSPELNIKNVFYNPVILRGETQNFIVYAKENLTADKVLERLLKRYRPGKKKSKENHQ